MCLNIHLRIKDNKLFLQTFPIRAQKVILSEMYLKRVIVDIILLLPAFVTTIADMAAFVLVATVRIKLIVSVKTLPTEAALGVPLKTTLVYCAGVIVAKFLMFLELRVGKELMFVGEDFFVTCA